MILVLNKVLGNYLRNSFSEKAFMSGLESGIKLKFWENDFSSSLKCPFLVAFKKTMLPTDYGYFTHLSLVGYMVI